jgi:hypothetical protein
MKPAKAGTPEHREHFAEVARQAALDLARALGTGELDDAQYGGLPVGDARCKEVLGRFLDTTECQALELFDRAIACRDLPAVHNVVTIKRKIA